MLNEEMKFVLSPVDFPELVNYTGQTLITTDGTTLLGADDKAGVAAIMAAMELPDRPSRDPPWKNQGGFHPGRRDRRGCGAF